MNTTVLYYKKCSACQKALKWLDANGVQYQEHPIREEYPGEAELKAWYEKSGLLLKKFFSTSGNLYKEMALEDKLPQMSEEEQLALLATNGTLVKRSLVVADDFAFIGFKEGEWKEKTMQGPETGRQRKRRSFLWRLFPGECLL